MVVLIGRRSGITTIASGLTVMLARLRPDRLLVITTDDPERSQSARLTSPHIVRRLASEH